MKKFAFAVVLFIVLFSIAPAFAQEATPEVINDVVVDSIESGSLDADNVFQVLVLLIVGVLILFGGTVSAALFMVYRSIPPTMRDSMEYTIMRHADEAVSRAKKTTTGIFADVDDILAVKGHEWLSNEFAQMKQRLIQEGGSQLAFKPKKIVPEVADKLD